MDISPFWTQKTDIISRGYILIIVKLLINNLSIIVFLSTFLLSYLSTFERETIYLGNFLFSKMKKVFRNG